MLLRVLLVDDEELTLRYLEKILDWESLGYRVGGKARNGVEALKLLEEEKWDLLVTDIRMPVMDGLALIEAARSRLPALKILVLSAFSDFEYARRSFGFGISGYLLKPVDEGKLGELLQKVRKEHEEEVRESRQRRIRQEITREALLKDIILGSRDEAWLKNKLEMMGTSLKIGEFQMLLILRTGEGASDAETIRGCWRDLSGASCALFLEEKGRWILVSETVAGTSLVASFLKELRIRLGGELFIGVSRDHGGLAELPEAYRELRLLGNLSFYGGGSRFLLYKKRYREGRAALDIDGERQRFFQGIRQGGVEEGLRYVDGLTERMEETFGPRLESLYLFCAAWLTVVRNTLREGEGVLMLPPGLTEISMERIRAFGTMEELSGFLKTLVVEMVKLPVRSLGGEATDLIREVKEFIAENYHRSFTLEELAESVGRSKNYLCRVFKESTGERIWEYTAFLRMEKAKHLLQFSVLKVGEIAHRVGYENSGYFTRVFRSHTGMNPQNYRENQS